MEAKGFQATLNRIAAAGAALLGVSKDSVDSHLKFRDKEGLEFPLLSDEDGDVCERYGVWKKKKMFGRPYMGIERTTFVIDPEGRIARVFRKVKVKGHAEEVLNEVLGS